MLAFSCNRCGWELARIPNTHIVQVRAQQTCTSQTSTATLHRSEADVHTGVAWLLHKLNSARTTDTLYTTMEGNRIPGTTAATIV